MQALVKIEDPAFYDHRGLNVSDGQGLTTITSSVARDLFLHQQDLDGVDGIFQGFYRAVFKCCKKIDLGRDMMAFILNSHATKQQQLNLFVNNTYWGSLDGNGVTGIEAAATVYYGKEVWELTDDEFYGLVAMLLSPNYYRPMNNSEAHAQRASKVTSIFLDECAPSGRLDLTYKNCSTGA